MIEWLEKLADPSFMPHGHCYLWRPDVLWMHVGSDFVIAIAYYLIPLVLAAILYKRRQSIPYPEILGLFVAFIFLCGTSHLMAIATTWYPAYVYEGYLKALTAVVSLLTAMVLVPQLPRLLALPGIQQAYDELKQAHTLLKEKSEQMSFFCTSTLNRENRIVELKAEVNELLEAMGRAPRYTLDSDSRKATAPPSSVD